MKGLIVALILGGAAAGLFFAARPRQLPLTIGDDSRRAPAEREAWQCIQTSGLPILFTKPPLVRWVDNPRFLDCGNGRAFLYMGTCHRGAFHKESRVADIAQPAGEAPSDTALVWEMMRAATRKGPALWRAKELDCRLVLRAKGY